VTPLRAMVNFTRLMIIVVFIVPLVLFGPRGIVFSILFGGAALMMAALALYGSRVMCWDNPPLRVWLWKHITFWFDDPEEVPE